MLNGHRVSQNACATQHIDRRSTGTLHQFYNSVCLLCALLCCRRFCLTIMRPCNSSDAMRCYYAAAAAAIGWKWRQKKANTNWIYGPQQQNGKEEECRLQRERERECKRTIHYLAAGMGLSTCNIPGLACLSSASNGQETCAQWRVHPPHCNLCVAHGHAQPENNYNYIKLHWEHSNDCAELHFWSKKI